MIAPEFPPKSTAGTHRSLRFCRFLPEFGWQPSVLSMDVTQRGGPELMNRIPKEVSVHRVGKKVNEETDASQSQPRHPANSKRGLSQTIKSVLRPGWQLLTETPDRFIGWSRLAGKEGIRLATREHVDLVYSSGPPHSAHLAAKRVAQTARVPLVVDLRDPWARRPWSQSRNPWGQRFVPWYERQVVSSAAKVILNTHASQQDFCKVYPEYADKFVCIPNGVDPELLDQVSRLHHTIHSDCTCDVPVICHPGNMYGHRNPQPILRAIAKLHSRGHEFKLQQIGAVADHFDPVADAANLGISHLFEVIRPMPHDAVLERMSIADMLLIIQPDAPLMVPGKVYEMLAFDQPLVAVCDSEATDSVVECAGGLTAASRDVDAIAEAILSAWRHRTDPNILQLRHSSRKAYDGRGLTERLAQTFLETLVSTTR